MTKRQAEDYARLLDNLRSLGFDNAEAETLIRIQKRLHSWDERCCGTTCENDDGTAEVYNEYTGKRYPCANLGRGAERRLTKLMSAHKGLRAYHQSDCRGCALYIVRAKDVPKGATLDSYYSRGLAVCY